MNPHSAAVARSGNPLKSRFESEIRTKIFSKSADPFTYSPPSSKTPELKFIRGNENVTQSAQSEFSGRNGFLGGIFCLEYPGAARK